MSLQSPFKAGEVKIPEDSDFMSFKNMCNQNDDWKQEVNKNQTAVWTKANDLSNFKMVKVQTVFDDLDINTIYDVLHDPEYRKTWDKTMIEGSEICAINPNNDIGYYAVRSPPPLKNRDFVTQRSWLDCGFEKIIMNHSVNHKARPIKKGIIRGTSFLTGYYLMKLEGNKTQLIYVSQSDPKGSIPVWAVNKLTKIFAPKVINRIYKAAKNYQSWKSKNRPEWKPWNNPEQMMSGLSSFNPDDVDTSPPEQQEEEDEGDLQEGEWNDEDF